MSEARFHDGKNGLKPSVRQWIQKIETEYINDSIVSHYLAIVKEMLVPNRETARYFEAQFSQLFPEIAAAQRAASEINANNIQASLRISVPSTTITRDDGTILDICHSDSIYGNQSPQEPARRRSRSYSDAGSPRRRSRRHRRHLSASPAPNMEILNVWAQNEPPHFPLSRESPKTEDQLEIRPPPDFDQLSHIDTVSLFDHFLHEWLMNLTSFLVISH